jgi:hypothetical protein
VDNPHITANQKDPKMSTLNWTCDRCHHRIKWDDPTNGGYLQVNDLPHNLQPNKPMPLRVAVLHRSCDHNGEGPFAFWWDIDQLRTPQDLLELTTRVVLHSVSWDHTKDWANMIDNALTAPTEPTD